MNKINKIGLILILAICSYIPSLAKPATEDTKFFIGDIVDDVIDDIEDKFTPFKFTVRDLSSTPKTISHEARQLRLTLFYKKDLARRFNAVDDFILTDALNESLEILSFLPKDPEGEELFDDELSFSLEFKKLKTGNKDFFKAQFISNEITIDEAQKLFFELDLIEFMDEINVVTKSFSKTPENTINFKPIIIELEDKAILDSNTSISTEATDPFASHEIKVTFEDLHEIDANFDSVDFQFTKNLKIQKAVARSKKKKIPLNPVFEDQGEEIISKENGIYNINIPVRFELKNLNHARFIRAGKAFKVKVPFKIETFDSTGLELKIKGFAFAKLNAI